MLIEVLYDGHEYLVVETAFYMHAGGPTVADAFWAFGRLLERYRDILTKRETTLGDALKSQLEYLRAVLPTKAGT